MKTLMNTHCCYSMDPTAHLSAPKTYSDLLQPLLSPPVPHAHSLVIAGGEYIISSAPQAQNRAFVPCEGAGVGDGRPEVKLPDLFVKAASHEDVGLGK